MSVAAHLQLALDAIRAGHTIVVRTCDRFGNGTAVRFRRVITSTSVAHVCESSEDGGAPARLRYDELNLARELLELLCAHHGDPEPVLRAALVGDVTHRQPPKLPKRRRVTHTPLERPFHSADLISNALRDHKRCTAP